MLVLWLKTAVRFHLTPYNIPPKFFLRESHLGQNRALSSLPELSALNPHVYVTAHTDPLDQNLLLKFQVGYSVTFCDLLVGVATVGLRHVNNASLLLSGGGVN